MKSDTEKKFLLGIAAIWFFHITMNFYVLTQSKILWKWDGIERLSDALSFCRFLRASD